MAFENVTSCPICDHKNSNLYILSKDYTVSGEEFALRKCSHCNFIFTSPRPTPESIVKYYISDNYISHSGKSKTLFDKIYLISRNVTLNWKYKLIEDYFPRPGNLLDFGCGTGEFLNYMKNKNWGITGIEPNETARQKANVLLHNKVSQDLQTIKGNKMEVITLWHVLEHIHDLNNTLQILKSILSPTGHIIIAVPNLNSHDCKHYKHYWAAYDVPRHLWHFTQETMTSLLMRNGLKIVQIKPMKLDSFYVSLLSEGYKNPNQSKPIIGLKALIEGLISNISARKIQEYSSLIYIAKPK